MSFSQEWKDKSSSETEGEADVSTEKDPAQGSNSDRIAELGLKDGALKEEGLQSSRFRGVDLLEQAFSGQAVLGYGCSDERRWLQFNNH